MLDPSRYNRQKKVYTNPQTGAEIITYCHAPLAGADGFNAYPYPQPYKEGEQDVLRDPLTPFIYSDMFFQPKQVANWDDQVEKWV